MKTMTSTHLTAIKDLVQFSVSSYAEVNHYFPSLIVHLCPFA